MEIEFHEQLIQYEDGFLRCLEQPDSLEKIQQLVEYGVLYSGALMNEKRASYIELRRRVSQLWKNAQILVTCRLQLRFDYRSEGPIIDAIDETIASIEEFVGAHLAHL